MATRLTPEWKSSGECCGALAATADEAALVDSVGDVPAEPDEDGQWVGLGGTGGRESREAILIE